MFKPDMKYTNSRGDVFEFGDITKVYLDESDLFDYEWDLVTSQSSVVGATRVLEKKDIKILFLNDTDPSYINRFLDIVDYDVRVRMPGLLEVDGYSRKCLIYSSKGDEQYWKPGLMYRQLTAVMVDPDWMMSTEYVFESGEENNSGAVNYPYNYPHNYSAPAKAESVVNGNTSPSDFILRIYGPAVNPSVRIGGNLYSVNVDVDSGGYLTIDSSNNTIVNRTNYGEETNVFDPAIIGRRGSGSFIFEKINPGVNLVEWSRAYKIALTIIEGRSEPKRTAGW